MATTIKKSELVKTSTELIKLFGIKPKDWDPKNQDEEYMKGKILEAMADCFEEGDEISAASQKVIDAVQAEAKAATKSAKNAPAKGKGKTTPEPDEDEDTEDEEEDTEDEDEDEDETPPAPAKKKGTKLPDPDPEPDEDEDEDTIESVLAAAKSMVELKAVQTQFPAIFTKKVLKGLETAKNPIMLKKAMKDAAGIVSAPKPEKVAGKKGSKKDMSHLHGDPSKSNKGIVYLAWVAKKTLTPEQLHAKCNEGVQLSTIKSWLSQWKLGTNLPAIAKK